MHAGALAIRAAHMKFPRDECRLDTGLFQPGGGLVE